MKNLKSHLCKLAISAFLIFPFFAMSQQTNDKDSLVFKISIAKASDNDFTKGKPAEFIGTFPSSSTVENNWLANAFLETSFSTAYSRWSFGLIAELHRNTLIEKEQNVRQFGLSVGKIFRLKSTSIGASAFDMPLTLNIKKSEDLIKDVNELQAILGLSFDKFIGPQILKTKSLFPSYEKGMAKAIMFSHDHNLGLAYLGEDNVLLGQFDFELNLFFLPILSEIWVDRPDFFKAQFTYNSRTSLVGDSQRDLNSQYNFQLGINLPFGSDSQNSLGVAHDWLNGADPLKGLENQHFRTITVKAKIILKQQ